MKREQLRVLFAGGGTAGHINPALAVADELKKQHQAVVAFAGTPNGLEADLVPRAGYDLHHVQVKPFVRRINLDLLKAFGQVFIGFGQAVQIIRRFQPHVVVGTGGYVAGPVLLAAVMQRIPTVIHEQNAFPGGTNRALARVVQRVALGYAEASRFFAKPDKLVTVGNPIRTQRYQAQPNSARQKLGLHPAKRTFVIFGGSRGARSINEAVFAARKQLNTLENVQIVHQTGAQQFPHVKQQYEAVGIRARGDTIVDGNIHVMPYIYDMPTMLAAADLVLSRAGALSVAEITAYALPSILVPYPYATGDHQTHNAQPLVKAGAAIHIADNELTGEHLSATMQSLIHDTERLRQMGEKAGSLSKPRAVQHLAEVILSVRSDRS